MCIIATGLISACSRPENSPQAVARAFMDRFFVEASQHAALALTQGVAHAKVEEELRLLRAGPPGTAAERPHVFYRQLGQQNQDDGVTFHFQLTVVVLGDPPLEPEVIVRVRPDGDEWRVSNYEVLPPRERTPAA